MSVKILVEFLAGQSFQEVCVRPEFYDHAVVSSVSMCLA
mgnify:FL=1|jgi:hypothetical protein